MEVLVKYLTSEEYRISLQSEKEKATNNTTLKDMFDGIERIPHFVAMRNLFDFEYVAKDVPLKNACHYWVLMIMTHSLKFFYPN